MALYISASLIRLSLTNLMSSGVTVNNSLPSLLKTDNVVFFPTLTSDTVPEESMAIKPYLRRSLLVISTSPSSLEVQMYTFLTQNRQRRFFS